MQVEHLPSQALAASRGRDRNRQNLGSPAMMRDVMNRRAVADLDPVGDDAAIEQERSNHLAPAAVERRTVKRGELGGVARPGFGHARLPAREQIGDEALHRRAQPGGAALVASGARR